MVSALVSGSSDPGSSPDRGHCVVFRGCFPSPVPPSLSTMSTVFISVAGACFLSFLVGAHGCQDLSAIGVVTI